MPPWAGRFDNALHWTIMRDLRDSGRGFLARRRCYFGPALLLKAD